MNEFWTKIKGFETYEVSDRGRVRNKYGKIRKFSPTRDGYDRIVMYINNKDKKTVNLHKVVAIAFIPNPENKPCINHIDGNKKNNKVDNLEWVTPKENTDHAIRIGLIDTSVPSKFIRGNKLQPDQVIEIFNTTGDYKEIAKKYNVHKATVSDLKRGLTWSHITGKPKYKSIKNA